MKENHRLFKLQKSFCSSTKRWQCDTYSCETISTLQKKANCAFNVFTVSCIALPSNAFCSPVTTRYPRRSQPQWSDCPEATFRTAPRSPWCKCTSAGPAPIKIFKIACYLFVKCQTEINNQTFIEQRSPSWPLVFTQVQEKQLGLHLVRPAH